MAISKEEQAVLDALAVVQADTGIQKANAALGISIPTSTTKSSLGGISDIDTSTAFGKKAAEILNKAQSFVEKTEPKIVKQYADLGYNYNPLTGSTTPITQPKTEEKKVEQKQEEISKDTQDAFAILKSVLSNYGLDSLYGTIEGYMKSGLGPEQAKLKIKQEPAYLKRFAGNEKRRTAGLNVLSEAEYLSLEDAYNQTLRAYGQQTYFGNTAATRQEAMANLIGNDISATEFKDRIDLAVTRVNNADPAIKTQLKAFYNIEDTDLVGYFLNPTQNLPKLEEKVKAAEIGSAAAAQNLSTSLTTAEDLARYGVDLETARRGYSTIADVLPTATKLGAIYDEDKITYGQAEAEAETFKGLASAQRKRQQLAAKEIGTFSGQSGAARGFLSKGSSGAF